MTDVGSKVACQPALSRGDGTCASWAQVANARTYNDIAEVGLGVGSLTLLAAGAAAIYSRRASVEARKQATAALQQVDIARAQARGQITLHAQALAPLKANGGGNATLITAITNSGSTEACRVRHYVQLEVSRSDAPNDTVIIIGQANENLLTNSILPGKIMTFEVGFLFEYQPIENWWKDSWLKFVIKTTFEWDDVFGSRLQRSTRSSESFQISHGFIELSISDQSPVYVSEAGKCQ